MENDKIRIRVSDFVETILYNDAQAFEFIKNDDSTNMNSFLNKLIPILLVKRKERRALIHKDFTDIFKFNDDSLPERTRFYVDTIIDKNYFGDSYLGTLSSSIWIRPNKKNLAIFDEINEHETYITQQDLTTCIRHMLNEYSILHQYKREQIIFQSELKVIQASIDKKQEIIIQYNDEKFHTVVLKIIPSYAYDQNNYILCFDLNNRVIKSFYLHKMKNIYPTEEYYLLDNIVYNKLNEIMKEQLFEKQETFLILEE